MRAMPPANYFDRETVLQAIEQAKLLGKVQDAGLAWILLTSSERSFIPNVRITHRFNLLEITFPKHHLRQRSITP
jgi:hypothetical protein